MRKFLAVSTAAGAVALPTVVVVAPPSAVGQATEREEALPFCSTYVLTAEQITAGVTSRVDCYATLAESRVAVGLSPDESTEAELSAARAVTGEAKSQGAADRADGLAVAASSGNLAWARHYDYVGGGASFTVSGPATGCDGSGISFAAGDPWNDRISSTRHYLCGKVKHWTDGGFGGNLDITVGLLNQLLGLGGLLDNQATSMRYFPS
jgi:hypothetical protein